MVIRARGVTGTEGQLKQVHIHRILMVDLEDYDLHDFPEKVYEKKAEMSMEDKQFMRIMSTSATIKDGQYQLKLPLQKGWHLYAKQSWASRTALDLKGKTPKDASFHQEYRDFLEDVIHKGHAEMVSPDQLIQEAEIQKQAEALIRVRIKGKHWQKADGEQRRDEKRTRELVEKTIKRMNRDDRRNKQNS